MLNAFDLIPAEARKGHLDSYREFLDRRDGDLDLGTRTLSNRERTMARFENIAPKASLDPAEFKERYQRFDRTRETSAEMMLLLALVKVNAAEAFGVNYAFEELLRRAEKSGEDLELRLMIEEHYHTRILLSTAREFGIEVTESFRPPFSLRTLIGTITSIPMAMARPLTLASEVYGTTIFYSLLKRAGQILKHRPELRDAVEERIVEVLIDEMGHVTFNRLGLGSWGLWQARTMVPLVARGLGDFLPELGVLGVDMRADLQSLRDLPQVVRDHAFVV
jgi:hypothetical protein